MAGSLGAATGFTTTPALAENNNIIGFGAGLFTESSERTNESEPDVGNGFEGSEEFESDGSLNLQLWYLRSAGSLLFGGGVAFYNDYSMLPTEEDGDDPEPIQYGNLFQVYGEGDFLIPLGSSLDLMLGARLGLLTLFQSRELEREIEEASQLGFSVWPSMPRLGFFGGPHVGALWGFSERIGLRGDFGVQFSKLWLYSGEAEDVGIFDGVIERSATLSTTRYQLLLGLHVGF